MVNAVLAPILAREFGLTAGQLGLLSSMYFLAFAFTQLPFGVLLDRFGPRRVNGVLLVVAAAGGAWFAQADTASSAILARAVIGVGVSMALMSALTAFALWYPAEKVSTMNSVAFTVGILGAMSVTVPLEMLLRVWSWREAFMLIAGMSFCASLVLFIWVSERIAAPKASLAMQLRDLGRLLSDAAFLRLAVCLGASQSAAISLQSLWIATWLRDVAGYDTAQVARGLLAVHVAMIAGYVLFGTAADRRARQGRSALPLMMGGVAASAASLALVVAGFGSLVVWALFVGFSTAGVLGYSILTRRYPRDMAGRANTAINVAAFIGMFAGQWGIGLVLDRWPQSAAGYAAEAYPWALAIVLAAQAAGLAWLWSGRRLLD
jgi:predicted MFS family arabinose efflux permease